MDSSTAIKYSTRIDAADLSDGQRTCCKLPLRWGTVAFGIFFAAAGLCQIMGQVYGAEHSKSLLDLRMNIIIAADSNTFQQLQGYYSTLSLWILIVSMVISGVAGLLGAFFEVRIPVTFFALMLFVQCILEIAWFGFEDGTGNFKEICLMIWNEVMLGKRSTDNTTAVNLFYIMLSLNIHLWACGVVASYALELRIAGKAVWFEPIEDDDEEETATGRRGTLKSNETPNLPEGYGSTSEATAAASQGGPHTRTLRSCEWLASCAVSFSKGHNLEMVALRLG
eukprot:symbB.v1.2.026899.t1/scaffold2724.1/size72221/5